MTSLPNLMNALMNVLWEQPRLGLLACFLLVAALIDAQRWQVPNTLTGGGALVALLVGLIEPGPAWSAALMVLGGWLLGLLLTLPLYAVKALGGGDVKLFAMVGAFLGPVHVPVAVLMIFITGGVLALIRLARRGTGLRWRLPSSANAVSGLGRMPYALSIGVGSLLYVLVFEPPGLQWSQAWAL